MNKVVMVIDDSPTVRKIVETCLKREFYTVICFENGGEALRWIRWVRTTGEATLPAFIFVDIQMPQMDGFEVVLRLRRQSVFATIPIVMLTRCDGVIDKLKARLAGATDLIGKPFKTQHLMEVVQRSIGIAEAPPAAYSYGTRSFPQPVEEPKYDKPRTQLANSL